MYFEVKSTGFSINLDVTPERDKKQWGVIIRFGAQTAAKIGIYWVGKTVGQQVGESGEKWGQ